MKEEFVPAHIYFEDAVVNIEEGVSVLETLEAANFRIPNSCRAGLCQSCMMQTDDIIPIDAQKGLTSSQMAQGYFLACSCYPTTDLNIHRKGNSDNVKACVVDKKNLNNSVISLTLQVDYRWFPGQYITVWKDELEGRPYSIASRCDQQKNIALHITRHDDGIVSRWLHDDLIIGDTISISTPLGDCFYTDDHIDKPILMAGTGTGLAPLYGILLEAIAKKHTAPIYLYLGAGDPSRLYFQEELRTLTHQNANLHYFPVVRRGAQDGMIEGDLVDILKVRHDDLKGWKVFLCGAPTMVKKAQRQCFFQGASVSDILVDAFESIKI